MRPRLIPTALTLLVPLAACQTAPERVPLPEPGLAVQSAAGSAAPAPIAVLPSGAETPATGAALAPTLASLPPGADCPASPADRVWAMPLAPRPGEPLTLVAVSTAGPLTQLFATDPAGATRPLPASPAGGPPWGLQATLYRPAAGTWRIRAVRGGRVAACAEVPVGAGSGERGSGVWDLPTRALFAVWVERLFDGPPEQSLSWPSLEPVLRDPGRNLLHDYLGAGEDAQVPAEPDCADLPYFLHAYFAWKLGLPVAYRACSRGAASAPPRCEAPVVESGMAASPASPSAFKDLSRRLVDRVHSGSGRTALAAEAADYYPVPLTREALWPGTVYADPYGHILVIAKWVPQRGAEPGMLLAVDAQPDNSVARKRYWEGNFLFAQTPSAGPGFKAYRPVVRTAGGAFAPLPNAALDGSDGTPPYSIEQAGLAPADFYARMERLINPDGLAPDSAYRATLDALMEQLDTRVGSVDTGEAYLRKNPGVVSMPSGPAIFETTGPWEDYATPSRDMRLLIAMKVLEGLPERIRRYPELYRLGGMGPEQAAARVESLHAARLGERSVTYTRSDGSPWRLSLADLYARRANLEVAYNPNDCVERRWGAEPGSPEYATCRREAPREQRERMEQYRPWFRETRRPPR